MTENPGSAFPLDLAAIARDMQQRFGWSEGDLGEAMRQLMPAAMSGLKNFGPFVPSVQPFLSSWPVAGAANPFSPPQFSTESSDHLLPFFGPKFVRDAVSDQIAQVTGLQREAIAEMMPVAATLAMGQVARPYLQGEARELLDAFLRGYARGRPKPVPGPADYIQGYTQAMQSFWSGFLKPFERQETLSEEPEADEPEEEEIVLQNAGESEAAQSGTDEPEEQGEFGAMVSDWMTAGRDFQSSQFKAFDSFFEKAIKDMTAGRS
ncbi:DUF937 domain-containing protein [Roseibium litorale]|uniref:DUF937 domain-containing protein n=1 Tax=Roseibium litorale TaxID=2803841 RepID=A0ABR9CR84_9HYPH|nr:DUF937 domain-containing protein [Roseibium litorale]MBD8892915.1 hypothetical protein [Roseibium litorale]